MTIQDFYEQIGGSYDDAVARLRKDALVAKYAKMFLQDPSYDELCAAVSAKDWKAGFAASHNLKGMCANLSFNELFKVSSDICENLRNGSPDNMVGDQLQAVTREYERVAAAVSELD